MNTFVFICVHLGSSVPNSDIREWIVSSQAGDSEPIGVIGRLMRELGKLPGIGPKSAERLTHYLLGAPRGYVIDLAEALRAVKEQIHPCAECCNPTESDRCAICADSGRDAAVLCVVEQPRDVTALERS